ncbi:MAG TPA: FAD-dependent oxidoreductase [Gammaproteobacteria bacterium]|nr:FAD-dependent oxidoreductase [Gammaproteobacteria bacterium]
MKPDAETKPVVVIGGGWAGIAAAVELARHDIPVILLESAKQLGGRARSVNIEELHVDNGQHMLLGAYESTLDLLRKIDVNESDVLQRKPLSLQWYRPEKKSVSLNTPRLPAPFHLAWALLTLKGLALRDRLSALRFARRLEKIKFVIDNDCSVADFLAKHQQSPALIHALWEPLCIGALNTHLHEASAQIFLRTLGDSFNHARSDSDLLLTRTNLGSVLPKPAADYIERHKGSVRLGQRVSTLCIENGTITGVTLDNASIATTEVILATPHTTTQRLLSPHTVLQETCEQITQLQDRPICTVYLQFDKTVRLGRWLRGSLGTVSQWIFDRGLYGQHGLMAVVISGDGEHLQWDNQKLCAQVAAEIATQYPQWPAPQSQQVIREKRATFASTVNVNQYRPNAETAVQGLWLAGDYTNTHLPATLEGAVRSGRYSAQQIIAAHQRQRRQ